MRKRSVPVVVLTAFLLLALACGDDGTRFSYTVSGCDESIPMEQLPDWAGVEIGAEEGVIRVDQRIAYVCCADIVLSLEREGHTLRVIEKNEGQICRCMCGYQAHAEIAGLPAGRYTVEVWGVEYPDAHPRQLLGQAQVELINP